MSRKFRMALKNIKAQMTVFIVLGFVILIIFMMLSLIAQSVKKARIQAEVESALQSFVETSTIQQYILSCVNTVLEDGMEKISLQGGSIYDYQYGDFSYGINTSNFLMGEDYVTINLSSLPLNNNSYEAQENMTINITYGMRISNNTGEFPYLEGSSRYPPIYPFAYKTLDFLNGFNYLGFLYIPMLEGFYGEITIPKLCVNQIQCGSEDSARFNNFNKTTYEEQLESYLEYKVKECVNFSYFEQETPHEITAGNITAEIVFSVDKVNANLDYPITLSWRGAEPVTEILTFNKNKKVRLAKVFKLAHTILKYDSFDLFFDPLDYPSVYGASNFFSCRMPDGSRCFDSQITVTKIPNVCPNCNNSQFDDLIVIRDNASKINGYPLQFQFLIENRRPALDYISFYPVAGVDIIIFENQTLELNPEGYDPDNTHVWYDYAGWRENYWTYFNETRWFLNPPADPVNFNFSDYTSQYFHYYHNPEPQDWTTSQEYIDTEQNASYHIQFGDLGNHKLNITIWDEEGLKDWQELNIFVRDLPNAVANGSNNFSDIGNANASIEDPYILDASLSYSIIGELADEFWYHWNEMVEPINIETSHLITILPYDVNYDIFNIPEFVFNEEKLGSETSREAVISLGVGLVMADGSIVYGEPDYLYLNVSQCLPHVNENDPNNPYPYNDTLGFQATHACCANGTVYPWGTRKPSSEVCKNVIEHASKKYFFSNTHYDDWYSGYLSGANDLTRFGYNPLAGDENDVYTRNFSRYCDGSRGNICNGSGVYDLILAYECLNQSSFHQTNSCYGPKEDYFVSSSVGGSADDCVVYSQGDTFEKFNQELSGDIPCSNTPQCYGVADLITNPLFKDSGSAYRTAESVNTGTSNLVLCEKAYCTGGTYTDSDPLGNCADVAGSDCYCSNSCGADFDCNNEDPGFNLNPTLNTWCNLSCSIQDCGFYDFDSSNYVCYEECITDNQCFDDGTDTIVCNLPNLVGLDHECLRCYNDDSGLQQEGVNGVDACEWACDETDSECDEKPQGALISYNLGAGCDDTCQFVQCSNNFRFNPSTMQCYTSCTDASQCIVGFQCHSSGTYCYSTVPI